MSRINVFLSEGLLEAIDEEASACRMSRSALIQRALTDYLEMRRREKAEREARREKEEAARGIDQLASKLGDWDPAGLIRDFRDRPPLEIRESRRRYRAGRRKRTS